MPVPGSGDLEDRQEPCLRLDSHNGLVFLGIKVNGVQHGQKVILPIWLDVSVDDVAAYSPTLADRVAANASDGLEQVVDDILNVVRQT